MLTLTADYFNSPAIALTLPLPNRLEGTDVRSSVLSLTAESKNLHPNTHTPDAIRRCCKCQQHTPSLCHSEGRGVSKFARSRDKYGIAMHLDRKKALVLGNAPLAHCMGTKTKLLFAAFGNSLQSLISDL